MKFVIAVIFVIALFVGAVFTVGYIKPANYQGSISKTFPHSIDSVYNFCTDIESSAMHREGVMGVNIIEQNAKGIKIWHELQIDGGMEAYELVTKERNRYLEIRRTTSSKEIPSFITYNFSTSGKNCYLTINESSSYNDPFYNTLRIFTGADKELKNRMKAIDHFFLNKH